MGEWRYSSIIFDLGSIWRWMVSFPPRPLYLRENRPRYPLDKRLFGAQSRSGRYGEDNYFVPVGNGTSSIQPVALRCTDWAIFRKFCSQTNMECTHECVFPFMFPHISFTGGGRMLYSKFDRSMFVGMVAYICNGASDHRTLVAPR
jgi:hypothetical protein